MSAEAHVTSAAPPASPADPRWWVDVFERQVAELAQCTGLAAGRVRERLCMAGLARRTPRRPRCLPHEGQLVLPALEMHLPPPEPEAAPAKKKKRAARMPDSGLPKLTADGERKLLARLTGLLREVGDALGLRAVEVLVTACGGRRLYIPKEPSGSRLERLLGSELLKWLCREYGGTDVRVKSDAIVRHARRDAEVRRRYDADESARELAEAFRLSIRQVYRILGDPEG